LNLSTRMVKATFAVVLSLFVLLASIATAPATYAASIVVGGKAVVANTDGDAIRIRAGAGTDEKQVGEAHEGDIVTVVAGPRKDDDGRTWYKVEAPDSTGWMSASYLKAYEGKSQPAKSTTKITGSARVTNTDGDPLNVRSEPSRDSKIVGTLPADTVVSVKAGPVTDKEGIAWYQISASGVSGWAMAQYLAQASAPAQSTSKAAPATPRLSGFARVANTDGDHLNVRAEPNRNSRVVATLAPNTSVAIKAGPVSDKEGQAWYQISANAVTGWAMAQYLVQADAPPQSAPQAQPASQTKPATKSTTETKPAQEAARSGSSRGSSPPPAAAPSNKGNTVVNIAMQYVGARYRFGGTSPSGFDCSGYVYYVLNKAGVPVGRSMEAQLNSGPRVSSKSLQPGDLVFFVNTYKRGLSHAGIYIGNGKFVHAQNEGTGVVVSALWSSYWAGHYYTAVRPYR